MRSPRLRTAGVSAAVALVLGAVIPAGAVPERGGAECPLRALEQADGPVEITFWHSMPRANEETLVRLTDAFNSSQDDVRVTLVNQVTYDDTLEKFRAGLATDALPDIVQLGENALQQAIDSQAVLPAQACVEADDYDLTDHLPRVVDYYTVEDTLWAMPFNVSNPILYYDKTAFRQAGLDPERPPATLDEVREYAEQIKASGYPAGLALKIDAWFFEQQLAKSGAAYVDHGNGRKARAGAAEFDAKTGREVFTWLADMVDDGLLITNPRQGEGEINNYLALGNGQAAMTIDTTAALGTISQVLGSGQFASVELGVGPLPGPSGKGGVSVGGGALFIVSESSPARQAAAWEFAKFLNQPEQVAEWSVGTGYIPTRESAVELPAVQQRWAEQPGFRVAYEQLLAGKNTPASAGPVIGDFLGVRAVVEDQETEMFANGKSPKKALRDAKREADAVIAEYNDRIGA